MRSHEPICLLALHLPRLYSRMVSCVGTGLTTCCVRGPSPRTLMQDSCGCWPTGYSVPTPQRCVLHWQLRLPRCWTPLQLQTCGSALHAGEPSRGLGGGMCGCVCVWPNKLLFQNPRPKLHILPQCMQLGICNPGLGLSYSSARPNPCIHARMYRTPVH